MNPIKLLIFLFLTTVCASAFGGGFRSGIIDIKFEPGYEPERQTGSLSGIAAVDDILTVNGLRQRVKLLHHLRSPDLRGLNRIYRFHLSPEADIPALARRIAAVSGVEYAEPAPVRRACGGPWQGKSAGAMRSEMIPNDPYYPLQWGLRSVYTPAAWDITQSAGWVIIAIVDNGVDWDHPDLAERIWRNSGEIPANGVDDDHNGFIDDIRGWDFIGRDNDPSVDDDLSSSYAYHGTHVSGIAAASMNNSIGVAGIAPRCAIMPVKAGSGNSITEGALGIIYAHEMGAQIINCSWGGEGASSFEEDAVAYALNGGSLVVAAAGNENVTGINHFPSAYEGVLAVASLRQDDTKGQSNYDTWVDVSAPGEYIYSTVIDDQGRPTYSYSSGTSMASPLAAGAAGLVLAENPDFTPKMLTIKMVNSCDDIYNANPEYLGLLGAGKVNAYKAVAQLVPGVYFDSLIVDDSDFGDGDGNPESGETFDLIITLENKYQDAYMVSGRLNCGHHAVTILEDSAYFGYIPSGGTGDNIDTPLRIELGSAGESERIGFLLDIITSTGHTFSLPFTMIANPPYVIHDAGNIVCTISNVGAVGYKRHPYSTLEAQNGAGFRYPPNGPNTLYHGSLLLSYGENFTASSVKEPFEWQSLGDMNFTTPGNQADQESQCLLNYYAIYGVGIVDITVEQKTYAWADSPYDDFFFIEYSIDNNSDEMLPNCYIGLFLDWDIKNSLSNSAGFNPEYNAGYMFGGGSYYYGMAALSGNVAAHTAVDNEAYNYNFTDIRLRSFMNGTMGTSTGIGHEYSHIIGLGPFDLRLDPIETVTLAILAGDDYDDFMNNAQAAADKYSSLTQGRVGEYSGSVFTFSLSPPAPNPFNRNIVFALNLIRSGKMDIRVFDPLGREAALIHSGFLPAGQSRFVWNGNKLASGVYYLRAAGGAIVKTRKIVFLK